jgi:HlyD family secretion protein
MDRPLARHMRLWRKSASLIGLAGIAGGLAGAVLYLAFQQSADLIVGAETVTIAMAKTGRVAEVASFAGRAAPKDLVHVAATEGGRIAELFVETGELVAAGQPILRLKNAERELTISTRVAQLRGEINGLRGQEIQIGQSLMTDRKAVLEARYNHHRAREQLSRRLILLDKGLMTEAHVAPQRDEVAFYASLIEEAEQTEAANEVLRKDQLASIRQQMEANLRTLAMAEAQAQDFTVSAPLSGMVIGLSGVTGGSISAGDQIAEIDPRTGVMVEARLDEFYASRVAAGQKGTATLASVLYDLTVARVSPDVTDGTFRIELAFDTSPPAGLRAGETVQGRVMLASDIPAVTIPNGPFMESANGRFVFVVAPDGRSAGRRAIKTGARSPEDVAVLEGLSAGERVIVSDYESFAEAQTIEIVSP